MKKDIDIEKIVEHVKAKTRQIKIKKIKYDYLLIILAVLIYLIEVSIRRFYENRG